jgi:hypothetical protein
MVVFQGPCNIVLKGDRPYHKDQKDPSSHPVLALIMFLSMIRLIGAY